MPRTSCAEVEQRAAEQLGGKVDPVTSPTSCMDGEVCGRPGRHRRAAPAACTTTSPRLPHILDGHDIGSGYFSLSVYPAVRAREPGADAERRAAAACWRPAPSFKPCFCGPCFGAGDVPANNGLSIRHTTRNFPNREGSKPGERPVLRRVPDGRPLHRRHGRGTAASSPPPTEVGLRPARAAQAQLRQRASMTAASTSASARPSPRRS